MASVTTKSTFSLDLQTAASLERLAEAWQTSKSDVVRRLAREADLRLRKDSPVPEETLAPVSTLAARRLDALRALQSGVRRRGGDLDAWRKSIADSRR